MKRTFFKTTIGVSRRLLRSNRPGLPMLSGNAASRTALLAQLLARRLNNAPNTMSFHIGILARAGLVTSEQQGKAIVYRAINDAIGQLLTSLTKDFSS